MAKERSDAVAVWASAIIREVPVVMLGRFLDQVGPGPVSIGDACGNGCGSGCGNNCAFPIDRFGHTELSYEQIKSAVADKGSLREAVAARLEAEVRSLRG